MKAIPLLIPIVASTGGSGGGGGGSTELIVSAFKTTVQDAINASFTPVEFDDVIKGASYTTDNIVWTLPTGNYFINGCVGLGSITAGVTLQILLSIFVDDVEVVRLGRQYFTAADSWTQTVIGSYVLELSAESDVTIRVYQDKSGDPQPISVDTLTTWLQITKF